jgi:hypothetical protein
MGDEPLTDAPAEGNDQEAAEGAEVDAPVTEEELEDAPATEGNPEVPEESVD